jgi:hypothetical protein
MTLVPVAEELSRNSTPMRAARACILLRPLPRGPWFCSPQLSAALVLIASSHPQQIQRFAAAPVRVNIAPKGRLLTLAPVGVPDNIPNEVRETAGALIMTHQSRLAVTRELEGFRYSARQVLKAGPLPAIPLIVLTRGIQKWPDNERGNRMEALWQQLQTELAMKTANAVQIIALNSGHHIHLDQPRLVVDVIRLVAALHDVTDTGTRRIGLQLALHDISRRVAGRANVISDFPDKSMLGMIQPY